MSVDKVRLESSLETLAKEHRLESYGFLYLEDGRVKVTGNISLSAIAPTLLDLLAKRLIR